MKKEVIIPSGTKVTMYQDGDKVVIEYKEKKWKPKIGEVVICFDNIIGIYNVCGYPLFVGFKKGILSTPCSFINSIRPTTPDERATFFADLKKEGYKWDSKKMVLKKIEEVFVPKEGDFYKCTNKRGCIAISDGGSRLVGLGSYAATHGGEEVVYGLACGDKGFIRPATEAERQFLLDAMHKEGKDWDEVNKKVVDWEWSLKIREN